jgi:hypothetical protein
MNNYIYHGSQGLITLPERSVQTFPSGLVRIDRVYACRKTLVDRFRRDLAVGNPLPFDGGAPAIDGAFIFPDPQETIRDDGFAEFRVSAYGRTNTTGNIERQGQLERFDVFNFLYENYIFTKVLPSNVSLSQIFEPPQIDPVFEFQNVVSVVEYNGPVRLVNFGATGPRGVVYEFGANEKAFVIEFLSQFGTRYRVYRLVKGINYTGHTTQNFGTLSEYSIAYTPNIPRLVFASETILNYRPI